MSSKVTKIIGRKVKSEIDEENQSLESQTINIVLKYKGKLYRFLHISRKMNATANDFYIRPQFKHGIEVVYGRNHEKAVLDKISYHKSGQVHFKDLNRHKILEFPNAISKFKPIDELDNEYIFGFVLYDVSILKKLPSLNKIKTGDVISIELENELPIAFFLEVSKTQPSGQLILSDKTKTLTRVGYKVNNPPYFSYDDSTYIKVQVNNNFSSDNPNNIMASLRISNASTIKKFYDFNFTKNWLDAHIDKDSTNTCVLKRMFKNLIS